MLATLVACLFAAQDPIPAPAPKPAESPAAAAPAPVEAWSDAKAKAAVDEWTKLNKGSPSMADRNRGLGALGSGASKLLVKPLAAVVEGDKSVVLRKRAAELLANQPKAEANAAIRRLMKSDKVGKQPAVLAELVRGLSRCGYEPAQWDDLGDLFERVYHVDRIPLQEAILEVAIAHKEARALPLLLRNLDEPAPDNVDAAENPPTDYWEARWKSWDAWKGKVKDALFAVTGQRFSSAAEAKAWLKKNPLK